MKFERFDLRGIRQSVAIAGRLHGGRVVAQEYVPFAAWLLAWAAFTASLGLTNAVWLMAANGFVQAIRSLFLTQSFDAISARLHGPRDVRKRARRLAVQVDMGVLLASIGLLLAVVLGFRAAGLPGLAAMMSIIAIGLPARTPAVLALKRRNIATSWRIGSAVTMLTGAAVVLLFGMHWTWAALVLALRDWGGLFASLTGRPQSRLAAAAPTDLRFSEIAARTSMAARRRLVYRIGKLALGVLGPAGSIIARTGRGGGFDGRVAQKVAINPVNVGLLAMVGAAATAASLMAGGSPALLLAASAMARLTAAALSVLIWWRWFETADAFSDWLSDDI